MLHRPRLKSCFQVEIVEPEGVFLLSEQQPFLLTGHLYPLLVPLLTGHHTVDELVELLPNQATAAEVYYAVMRLEQQGYLVESEGRLPTASQAFYETFNHKPPSSEFAKVTVRAIGNVTCEPLVTALKSLDISVVASGGELDVILTDDYLHEELATFNHQAQRPWLLVKPVGQLIWLGPLLQPGKTACWACLAHRLRTNQPVASFIRRRQVRLPATSLATLPSTLQMAVNLAATAIIKWLVQGENPNLAGQLVTFNTLSWEMQKHILTRRPQCPSCGHPPTTVPPLVLTSRRKTFTSDGGHRAVTPAETLQRYAHHLSPLTGIVCELQRVTSHHLTPVYVAGHNFAHSLDELYFLIENVRGRSSGKGCTDVQAKASGFGEAIERYCGTFQGDEVRRKGSYRTLGEVAIHPNACMHFSEAQYRERHAWNAQCPYFFQKVPEPFDEEQEIDWTALWSLTSQEFKYLPTAYCYYGYLQADCWGNSNGAAAGNNKEEAILQGFMEVVERDSAALWWYNRLKKPKVNLASFAEPYFQDLQDYYRTLQRELWVLDLTGDLQIPTFVAISRRTDRIPEDLILGLGAHFEAKLAILRALTEMNQMLPSVTHLTPEGHTQYPQEDAYGMVAWLKTAKLVEQAYLLPDERIPPKNRSDYPLLGSEDLLEDVMTCVRLAEQRGLEVLVLDQTRPDVEMPVVKVVVPGMRHFWKRLAPGRLYEVPVELGWLSQPLQESQLNPIPIFF